MFGSFPAYAPAGAPSIGDIPGLQAALDAKADKLLAFVTVSGTSKTFGLSDAYTMQETTNGAATTLTIPTDGTTNFAIGTWIQIFQVGAGLVTIVAPGVTLQSRGNLLNSAGQFALITVWKRAANTWGVAGDRA